jgi:hypothetical protein
LVNTFRVAPKNVAVHVGYGKVQENIEAFHATSHG